MLSHKKTTFLVGILFLIFSVVFNFYSLKNILFGVYNWHIKQPETIQGGTEIIFLFLILCLMSVLLRKWKLVMFIAVSLLSLTYLKLHSVLFAALLSIIYLEAILSIGRMAIKLLKLNVKKGLDLVFVSFLIGIITWSFFALILSLLGYGGFVSLRLMTLCLFIISLFSKYFEFMTYSIYKRFTAENNSFKFGALSIWMLVLIQFAKSNSALDYDSIWYGFRPEFVLIGENSFFDQLGLSMFVHYYPKLYELIMVPISNLGDNSFIYSFTTILLLMLFLLIYKFLRTVNINTNNSLLFTLLIASIPAISNMGSTAKTDIFTTFFIVLTGYLLYIAIVKCKMNYFIYAISASFISFGGKPTSYLYIPLIYFGFIVAVMIFKRSYILSLKELLNFKEYKIYYLILSASVFVWIIICYRTIKLTGYPIYPILGGLWDKMGFTLKYPFVTNVELLSHRLNSIELVLHWLKIIFDPSNYIHYVMVWPGNLYLYLFIFTLFLVSLNKKIRTGENLFLLVSIIPIMAAVVYYISTIPDGGDGNYFTGPIIIALIVCLKIIVSYVDKSKLFRISIFSFILVQLLIMFVSHFSWAWGTSSFDLNFSKSEFDYQIRKQQLFEKEGIQGIEYYVKENKYNNCLGFGVEQTLNQLSCRFEDIPHINSRFGNSDVLQTEEKFLEYIEWAKVKYIILPYDDEISQHYTEVMKVINNYKSDPDTVIISDVNFYLLDISNVNEYKNYYISNEKE